MRSNRRYAAHTDVTVCACVPILRLKFVRINRSRQYHDYAVISVNVMRETRGYRIVTVVHIT